MATPTETPHPETPYRFRQSLSEGLRQIVTSYAHPAVNAGMARAGLGPGAFTEDSTVLGDMDPVRQPTICLIGDSAMDDPRFSDTYVATLYTKIKVKLPSLLVNSPEAFEAAKSIIEDTLRDVLNGPDGLIIKPKSRATGTVLLPAGMAFKGCHLAQLRATPFLIKQADGVSQIRQLTGVHIATIDYGRNRPLSLGKFG